MLLQRELSGLPTSFKHACASTPSRDSCQIVAPSVMDLGHPFIRWRNESDLRDEEQQRGCCAAAQYFLSFRILTYQWQLITLVVLYGRMTTDKRSIMSLNSLGFGRLAEHF